MLCVPAKSEAGYQWATLVLLRLMAPELTVPVLAESVIAVVPVAVPSVVPGAA